jgi:SOS-response transcriptional repressor LexA
MNTLAKTHIGNRITEALSASPGKNQEGLAAHCGVSPQAVTKWVRTGKLKRENLALAADYLGVSLEWLMTGIDSRSNVGESTGRYSTTKFAPVISFVAAGEWQEAEDPYPVGTGNETRAMPSKSPDNAFWLQVDGDSMINPNGTPSFPDGCYILVHPQPTADNGDLVVAKLTDTNRATFKKLVLDGGNKYLKPLNPAYPVIPINGNCTMIGVVKRMEMDF